MLDALALERLLSDDPGKFKLGIQCMPADGLAQEEGMAAALRALDAEDADVRFLASYQFRRASLGEIDISLALLPLERLFADDRAPPMHRANSHNIWLTASANAIMAVARFHARRGNQAALRAMLAEDGNRGVIALNCLSATDIAPFLDILQAALTEGDAAPAQGSLGWLRRHIAASTIAGAHWRKRDWPALETLLLHAHEVVRLGAFSVVDSAAEKTGDLSGILPAVLSTFDHPEPEFSETRHAAARVLLWFVHREKRPRVLWVNGVDILKIPEVQEERRKFRRLAKELARDK
jgi:hypothetical protein